MEFGFDNYSNDEAGNFYGYTDEAWFYQDPHFFPNQDMTQHMVQETQFDERGRRDERERMDERGRRDERGRMDERGRRDEQERMDERGRRDEQGRMDERGRRDERGRMDERERRDERGRMDERERRDERERMDDRGRRNPNNMSEMPLAPPPSQAPPHRTATFRVDANSIRHCIRRLTYIWQDNGMEYWMLPLNVSMTTVSGFRWNGRRWVFAGVSLRRIDSFTCI